MICHKCLIAAGWKRKGDGSHTGVMCKCEKCGNERVILPLRHYKQPHTVKTLSLSLIDGAFKVPVQDDEENKTLVIRAFSNSAYAGCLKIVKGENI